MINSKSRHSFVYVLEQKIANKFQGGTEMTENHGNLDVYVV